MGAFLLLVGVAAWLFLLVDGREFVGVMREGGWPSIALYVVLTIVVCAVLMTPDAAVTTAVHH